jgi:hypothetical protein
LIYCLSATPINPNHPPHHQKTLNHPLNHLGPIDINAIGDIYVDIWVEDGYPINHTRNAILKHLDTVMERVIVAGVGNHTITTV